MLGAALYTLIKTGGALGTHFENMYTGFYSFLSVLQYEGILKQTLVQALPLMFFTMWAINIII